MQKTFKAFFVILIVIFLSVGLVWFLLFFNKSKTLEHITFSLKWLNQAQFAGVFVAKEKGFYKDEGLSVDINNFETGDSVIEELRNGESEVGLMSATDFLIEYGKREDILAVAVFYQVSPYIVASLKSKGIESPYDFRGKILGVKGGSGAEVTSVYDLLSKSAGLSEEDYTYKIIGLDSSEKDDLLSETADTVGFYRTRLYQFDKEGILYNVIYPEQYGAALYNDVLVVTKDFANNHPDELRSFVRSTIRGWEYAFDHKDEAVDITLSYITNPALKDFDYQKYILVESQKLIKPKDDQDIGIMDAGLWQRFFNVFKKRGLILNDFDVNESFTNNFVR